ncbi:MAG: ABC transporter substrate-binding protein [Lachnospiraceae bacterium]|nr:ABC transporter substrate-binding protein [Lachnospiraceae bacterium]
MKRFKMLALLLVSAMMTVALCGCGGDKTEGGSSKITIGIPQDLDCLDPHTAVAAGTKEILFNIYEGLMKTDSDGNLFPAVAESYSVSDDGLTYRFTLRDKVKFHNDQTVTADDVLYCIKRNADDGTGNALISAFLNIVDYYAEGKDIVIVLSEPNPDFLQSMTMAITPKDKTDLDTDPVGTGPYKFVSRSPQENVILKRFDAYWGEKANIEDVTLKICSNADSIVIDLKAGAVDTFCRIRTSQVMQLQGSDFAILEGTMNLVQAMYLNNAVKPFDDVRVRQALSYAVDADEIIDLSFDGKGTKLGSSMFPAFGKYYIPETADVYNQDLDKAKALLAEAGYPNGFSFAIKVPSNYQPHIDTAQVVVEQLKKVGVTATIELIEWDSWLSDVYSGRDFEATMVGVDASNMTARAMLERFVSTSSKNFINFSNAEYDEKFAAAIASVDVDEQTKYYKECEWILTNDAANVYIQDLAEFVALRNNYTGYEFYPIYVMDIAKIKPVK